MNFPPKLVTVLCLVQFVFIMAGFLITRGCLKLYDHVVPGMLGSHTPTIPALASFVRAFGLWFLLIPFLWSLLAAARADVTHGIASISLSQFMIGVALTGSIVLLFSSGALYAVLIAFRPI